MDASPTCFRLTQTTSRTPAQKSFHPLVAFKLTTRFIGIITSTLVLFLYLAASGVTISTAQDRLPEKVIVRSSGLLQTQGSAQRRREEVASVPINSHQFPARHVIIATAEAAPFMMKREKPGGGESNNNTSVVEWYGYCMDFFNELIKHLPYNLTYEIYQVPDNKFGAKVKRTVLVEPTDSVTTKQPPLYKTVEQWNGLIGDLAQGKAHLALAPLSVMAERELAIEFTVPFYDLVGIQILLKKPEVPRDWFKFLTVLDLEVWVSITIAYFVTSIVIFLFDRLSPYSHKNLSRIQKMKRTRKIENKHYNNNLKNSTTINSVSTGVKDSSSELYASRFINGESRIGDQNLLRGNHLTKSHELFVGSLMSSANRPTSPPDETTTTSRRRSSSVLFFSALNSVLKRRKDSTVFPTNDQTNAMKTTTDQWQHHHHGQHHRGSTTLSDYFRGIELRKGDGPAWAPGEDTGEGSDVEGDGKPDFGLRDSLWFCITSLTPQGGGEAPQNLSGRVVAGAWWLFCFIIIASYTANLAAFLTVSRLDIPIESLDDLAKQYRIKYSPVEASAESTYFERMAYIEEIFYNIWKDMSLNDSLSQEERSKFAVWDYPISDKYTKIWAQIQQVGMPPDTESGIRRVKESSLDDGFALLADANMVKHAMMTDCSFKVVGDEFSRKPIALGVRKGDDQFRDDLSYAILQLINQRFMEILREKWWTNNPNRVICDNNDESEGISIENIGGVFIIIFAGVVLSFVVWAIERYVYKTKIGISRDLIQKL